MAVSIKNIIVAFLFCWFITGLQAQDLTIEQNFKNPPPSAKARTWWHWINGNVSREGITSDLEAMKSVGIQGVQLFNVSLGNPEGSATYLGEEWLELFEFSAQEASRLGLELGFHNGPGWSSSGGPWITPEYAMQSLVFSEVIHQGGMAFKGHLPKPETRLNYYKDIAVLAFPKPKSDERIDDLDIKILSERIRNHLAPDAKSVSSSALVHIKDIIDLTAKVAADGMLEWNAPDGQWVILRLGHTPTGAVNRFASAGGKGLECDKMNRKAVDLFWKGGIHPIIEKLDTLIGSVVSKCHIDSYEVGTANWTADFEKEFKRLRTYNCLEYLPTMAGYYVESGEITERFLWDFRRTIGDLIAEHYYGHFSELCHQHGMKFSVEPYWGPFDNMQVGESADLVMSEFWSGSLAFFDSPKFVASIAKLNGNPIAEAEAFTAIGGWDEHPASLKAIGDRAWAQGINGFVFHTYVHQPWDVGPGLTLGVFGIDFNRLNTWWEQGKDFLDYIGRGQFLLQQGRSFADILVFTGESSPNDGLLIPEIKALGFDYDLIGKNKIGLLSVKDGLICTPHGGKYHALVLPETTWATPETVKIIEKLSKSGATIFGTQAQKSPSLQNYPGCDMQVAQLSEELWEADLIREGSILDFLRNGTLPPDFSILEGNRDNIDFIHRKTEEADIYFVANSRKESREVPCRFRVAGKQPELWNAETGEISNTTVWHDNGDGTTTIPIQFESEGSFFVVFRNPDQTSSHIVSTTMELQKTKLEPLPDLKILKAEYGAFLPDGLVDVTEVVENGVQNNTLNVIANRDLCSCDPAPGYIKELRIEYKIGDVVHEKNAVEKEQLRIDAMGEGELKILKAVFGKFERGVAGIPPNKPVYDVTEKIESKVSSGVLVIAVNDSFVDGIPTNNNKKALRVVYLSNGEEHMVSVPKGHRLNLAQTVPEPKLITNEDGVQWITPYAGKMTYTTSLGKTKTIKVKSVPEPIELSGSWEVNFPAAQGAPDHAKFDKLTSWSLSTDEGIRYFSGTASYKKQFELPKQLFKSGISLELDLGSVWVIAEVILNGNNLGVLWKAPYRINIDDLVNEGANSLEVKITNLWPNRLIGDELLAKDSERLTFAGYKHWDKDSKLQPSGLLGPVQIFTSKVIKIK